MPRYYFDIEDGVNEVDRDGLPLSSLKQARMVAVETLIDIARISHHSTDFESATIVRDEDGARLLKATIEIKIKALD